MLSGIYSAVFHSNLAQFGTGVAIFTEDNRVHGEDATYYYRGKYVFRGNDQVEATVEITAYTGVANSVLGPLANGRLNLKGSIQANELTLKGSPEGLPSITISIQLCRLADLAEL